MQPLSERMLRELQQKNMTKESAILVRVFKQESELEVWKQDNSGSFALLKTYPICRWSGELGPKIKEGDRQAPEGFYSVTPAQMNPNSSLYLSFNMGFPNAFDRAHGRTGAHLMVHGDCSSRGCYAMTDEQISEIYAFARESFFGGQRSFQIQAYPFRMTPANLAKHRNSPHMAFWRMLKQGSDHFEVTKKEPKVDVCEKRYVFDAESSGKFSPADKCPIYTVPAELAAAVKEKQRRDDVQLAELISRGVPAAPARTGTDGGMNTTFLAALKSHDGPGTSIRTAAGTIPAHVNPPGEQAQETTTESAMMAASADPKPAAPASAPAERTIIGHDGMRGLGSFFGNFFGSKTDSTETSAARDLGLNVPIPKPKPAPAPAKQPQVRAVSLTDPKQSPEARGASGATVPPMPQTNATVAESGSTRGLLGGAQPVVPSGGFDSRFGAWR